jgi:hypothetical protein
MSIQISFSRQIQAFHAAILDDCDRASRPDQHDAMVLRLRANALALAKVQLALAAVLRTEPPEPVATASRHLYPAGDPPADSEGASPPRPSEVSAMGLPGHKETIAGPPLGELTGPREDGDERALTGDTLSRFVSHRLTPDESPYEVWQRLQEADPPKRRRNPALPGAGFRSSSR